MNERLRLVCVLVLLTAAGCQLPLANYLRDEVFPKDTTAKIAMSPLLLPGYAVASVLDVALINPVRGTKNVPSVTQTIWEWEDHNIWLGKGLLLPLKLVAIPAAAIGTSIFSEQFIYQENINSPTRPAPPSLD